MKKLSIFFTSFYLILISTSCSRTSYIDLFNSETPPANPSEPILSFAFRKKFLQTERGAHASTVLPNGKVLVTGGTNGGGGINSVELYDPATEE